LYEVKESRIFQDDGISAEYLERENTHREDQQKEVGPYINRLGGLEVGAKPSGEE